MKIVIDLCQDVLLIISNSKKKKKKTCEAPSWNDLKFNLNLTPKHI